MGVLKELMLRVTIKKNALVIKDTRIMVVQTPVFAKIQNFLINVMIAVLWTDFMPTAEVVLLFPTNKQLDTILSKKNAQP